MYILTFKLFDDLDRSIYKLPEKGLNIQDDLSSHDGIYDMHQPTPKQIYLDLKFHHICCTYIHLLA